MRVILDLEGNGYNPTKVWLVVCQDVTTCQNYIFRNLTDDEVERNRFKDFVKELTCVIGHNILAYDVPVLRRLLGVDLLQSQDDGRTQLIDTYICSKLIDYPRERHSVENYGEEFNLPKGDHSDFTRWSLEMEEYCIRDCDITRRIYLKYKKYIDNPLHKESIEREHQFQGIVNNIEDKGFMLDVKLCTKLLDKVTTQLCILDSDILSTFVPKLKLIREITPKETKYGTISLTSIPKAMRDCIPDLTVGAPFSYCSWVAFNPASHKQILGVLNEAGWQPVAKTKAHIVAERRVNQLKRVRDKSKSVASELSALYTTLTILKDTGWKVNEENLSTLPASAPAPARLLAKRILYEARRRTLTEWLGLVRLNIRVERKNTVGNTTRFGGTRNTEKENTTLSLTTDSLSKIMTSWLKTNRLNADCVEENDHSLLITIMPLKQYAGYSVADAIACLDGLKTIGLQSTIISSRVHGKFQALGTWTHRMSHQKPNMANVTNEFDLAGNVKLLGKELRQCWTVPKDRLLVGVDAEGIQLRIFAHYINDAEFIDALVRGRKDDKSDPHSLNQRILGSVCKSRAAAKRFIFALLLGAGIGKLGEILACDNRSAEQALERLLVRYTGFATLKSEVIPADAERGWFSGIDGRRVRILGETIGARRHLAMSGYLQNGEAVSVKTAAVIAEPQLAQHDAFFVDIIHDEFQVEVPNDFGIAIKVAEIINESIRRAGDKLGLLCPLAGSYRNDHGDYTFGRNWYETH